MTEAQRSPASAPTPLPPLRSDLVIEVVAERGRGYPSVVITDPVRGSYFRLSWPESGILLHWRDAETIEALCQTLASTYGAAARHEDVVAVAEFAFSNQLTVLDQAGSWQRYAVILAASRPGWFRSAIHGYLFFRVPLVHPEPWLHALELRLRLVFERRFWAALCAMGLLALYLASRQWSAVIAGLQEALKLEGLAIYAVAILCLKAVHELGHALATVHLGCRVPTMGVAVMLGAPVFYTDTSDSWRLARRSDRLMIVFSGVAAELIVATLAILLWSFLGDGILRQICFAFATTSIALSIAINLNPFMRFDGYFALSDWLEVPNLQARSFGLMAWKLREALFDLREPVPERLSASKCRLLIAYAVATAVYRLGLYLGIAALVYTMAGKALGIVLGLFEVIVFIAFPIAIELAAWWGLRREIAARRRIRYTGGTFAVCSALLFLPWITTVQAPATIAADNEIAIYLPFAARLASMNVVEGGRVEAGAILFTAEAPDLNQQRLKAELELRSLEFQSARLHASDKERELRSVIESRLVRAREKVEAVQRQLGQLILRAPFDGRIVDVDPDISAGLWLNQKRPLARLVSAGGTRVKGLVADGDVERVVTGARAIFAPDDVSVASVAATVISIAAANDGRLAEPLLSDRHGGGVPSSEDRGELRTRHGWSEVELSVAQSAPAQQMRGVVLIKTDGISPVVLIWRQVMRVLVREQGF